jgi:hypothetical protein
VSGEVGSGLWAVGCGQLVLGHGGGDDGNDEANDEVRLSIRRTSHVECQVVIQWKAILQWLAANKPRLGNRRGPGVFAQY